jgi:hypothetical protein
LSDWILDAGSAVADSYGGHVRGAWCVVWLGAVVGFLISYVHGVNLEQAGGHYWGYTQRFFEKVLQLSVLDPTESRKSWV